MSFLAPLLLVLAVVLPAKLLGVGFSTRSIGLGTGAVGVLGLVLFITGFRGGVEGDPGFWGTIGILLIISALVAGITLFIAGTIALMSSNAKDKK